MDMHARSAADAQRSHCATQLLMNRENSTLSTAHNDFSLAVPATEKASKMAIAVQSDLIDMPPPFEATLLDHS
eukprot:2805448-Amphidinium_carterae.2